MGEVIRFPVELRQPHVALSWDGAWGSYLVQTVKCSGPSFLSWFDDYGEALDRLISLSGTLHIPAMDLTEKGRAA